MSSQSCNQSEMWRVVRRLFNRNTEKPDISLSVDGSITSNSNFQPSTEANLLTDPAERGIIRFSTRIRDIYVK